MSEPATIIHRSATTLRWWLAGLVLLALAWWGRPLLMSDQFENHFFGLFYYSILAGGALFWALPSEQLYRNGEFIRQTRLLGLITLRRVVLPLAAFSQIRLEQDPNIFGRDSIWLIIAGEGETPARLAFAHFGASTANVARAQALAAALSQASGLPIAEPVAETAE